MSTRSLVFSVLPVFIFALTLPLSSRAADPNPQQMEQDIAGKVRELRNFADAHGVVVNSLKISQNVDTSTDPAADATSCTATTTFDKPSGTENTTITVSATTASCTQSMRMLKHSIGSADDPS